MKKNCNPASTIKKRMLDMKRTGGNIKPSSGPVDINGLMNGIIKLRPDIDKTYAKIIAHNVSQASYDNNIDPYSLVSQLYQESRFRNDAVSPRGATGVAQLMEGAADKYGVKDRTDPVASIHAMARYMADNRIKNVRDKLPDSLDMAQMRYNAGGPSLKKWLKDGTMAEETRNYPEQIKKHRAKAFGDAPEPDYLYTGGIDEDDPLVDQYAVKAKRMRTGGMISYDAPTHEHGGQMVDQMGNETNDPSKAKAEIETKEVSLRPSPFEDPYVLSDRLLNPLTGNTIATDALRMEKKMKGDDDISLAGRKLSRSIMQRLNEQQKKATGAGGQIYQMASGGYFNETDPEPQPGQPNYEERLKAFRYLRDNPGATLPEQTATMGPLEDMFPQVGDTGPAGVIGEPTTGAKDGKTLVDQIVTKDGASVGNPGFTETANAGLESLLPAIGDVNVGSALKVGSGILSGIMSLQKAEKEKLQQPDYSAGDRFYADLGIDPQALKNQIMSSFNASRKSAQEGSGSFGQYMNRVRAGATAAGREMANVELTAKQYNDQVDMAAGQREDVKARTISQENIRQQTANSQNTAMRQDMIQNLLNQTDKFGTEMMANDVLEKTAKDMNDNEKKQLVVDIAAMEMKYPDFKISDEVKLLLTDPTTSWEQLREALAKDLVTWRGNNSRIGEIKAPDGN